MPLRILHSITSVDPATGGAIEGLKQLAAVHQAVYGAIVEIVSLDDPNSPWVASCPLPVHALGPGRSAYRYSGRLVPWLRAHRDDYDAVIVNGLWQYGSFAVWRALKGSATPYFVFPHGMLDPWFRRTYPLKHAKKWLFWPWSDYRVLRDAAAVLFTCEEERRLAAQSFWLYHAREEVVHFGTGEPPPHEGQQRRAFAERFPRLAGKRQLLFLGRMHPKKGTDLLLHAFARLFRERSAAQIQSLQLVMAGPNDHAYGVEMRALARTLGIEASVTWTGMLEADLKWGALRTADAFILPSHQENFGVAVVEALACATPVLISRQVNIWREIETRKAGFVEADDAAGTLRLLRRWLDCAPAPWDTMRQSARQCFEECFRVERAAENLVRTIERHRAATDAALPGGARSRAASHTT